MTIYSLTTSFAKKCNISGVKIDSLLSRMSTSKQLSIGSSIPSFQFNSGDTFTCKEKSNQTLPSTLKHSFSTLHTPSYYSYSHLTSLLTSSHKLLPTLITTSLPSSLTTTNNTITTKRNFASQKHKRIIKMAKGFRGRAKNTFKAAKRRVEKSLQYAYRDRRVKRRNYRKLWIERVNAGVRQHGVSYSKFIHALGNYNNDGDGEEDYEEEQTMKNSKKEGEGVSRIMLNRKVLAELAANEPFSFKAVVDVVKMKINAKEN